MKENSRLLYEKFKSIKGKEIVIYTWVIKILSVFFSFVNTRRLINLLGIDGFAANSILFSLLSWMLLVNLGLPYAFQNTVSKYKALNKDLNALFGVLLYIVFFLIIFSIVISIILSKLLKLYIFNNFLFLKSTTLFVVLLIYGLVGINEVFNKIFFAKHKGYIPNSIPAFIAILNFLILEFFRLENVIEPNLIIISYNIPYFLCFVIESILILRNYKPSFDLMIIKKIFRLSKKFFGIAILSVMVLNVDFFIIAKTLTSENIALYTLEKKMFALVYFLYTSKNSLFWPIMSELYQKQEITKFKEKMKNNIIQNILIVFFSIVIILLFKDNFISILSNTKFTIFPLSSLILFGVLSVVRAYSDTYTVCLQSTNEINIYYLIVPFQAIISMVGEIVFSQFWGINGILIGLIISYLLTVTWIVPKKMNKILNKSNSTN